MADRYDCCGSCQHDQRVRVAIVGVVVMALFCALLGRLWFLQVRESQTSVQINSESVRTVRIDSPRGSILDASGTVLVEQSRSCGP